MGANQTVFSAEDIYFLEKHSIMDRAQVEVGQGGWTIDGATTHVLRPWADRPPLKDEKLHLTGVVHQLQLQQFGDNSGKTSRQFLDNFAILRQLWDNFEPILGQLWDKDEKVHLTGVVQQLQGGQPNWRGQQGNLPKAIFRNPIWRNRVMAYSYFPIYSETLFGEIE